MFEQINDYLVAAYFYKKVMTLSKLIKEYSYYVLKIKLSFEDIIRKYFLFCRHFCKIIKNI